MSKTAPISKDRKSPPPLLCVGSVLTLLALYALTSTASAAVPDVIWKAPSDGGTGIGAGRLSNPRAVVADPDSGHVYVADSGNSRISEFTAWGAFVKAWGWGVVASGPDNQPQDEVQELSVDATDGSFALSFDHRIYCPVPAAGCSFKDTEPIPFDASAAAVQDALVALPSFEPGDALVSGPVGGPWTIEFAGNYADADIPRLEIVDSTLTGGSASASVKSLQKGANFEICVPAHGDVCRDGQLSAGGEASPGQIDRPRGIALDSAGNVYLKENAYLPEKGPNQRVQKFDPDGNFLLMFGGGVNQGPNNTGNLCTAQNMVEGDTCGGGVFGTGDGEFSNEFVNNYIVYNPAADTIVVGDRDRIQEFNPDGSFAGKVGFATINSVSSQFPATGTVRALAVDSAGNTYVTLRDVAAEADSERVFKLSPLTAPPVSVIGELEVRTSSDKFTVEPIALTTDVEDNVYVSRHEFGTSDEVLGFDSDGECIQGLCPGDGFAAQDPSPSLLGLGTNLCAGSAAPGSLYVAAFGSGSGSFITAYGSAPIGCEPPPPDPPEIAAQYAISVDADTALLKAQINPHFWPDTTYHVQYGTEACLQEGDWEAECVEETPAPGDLLTVKSLNSATTTAGVSLTDLTSDTAYRYRFIAESGGGGPVYGADPDGEGPGEASVVEGAGAQFVTFTRPAPARSDCPNQAFRTGPGAKLPDCRAYELVSPMEKGNGDIRYDKINGLQQSSLSGNGFTYSSSTQFGDPEASPSTAQYLARRDTSRGWLSEDLSYPHSRAIGTGLQKLENDYKAFSPDLCSAWLRTVYDPPLTEDAIAGYFNLYRRQNCGGEENPFEALTAVQPQVSAKNYTGLELQGISEDGSSAIYIASDSLTSDAPPQSPAECINDEESAQCNFQLYERDASGQLHFVCVLPNGNYLDPTTHSCFAGTTGRTEFYGQNREGSFQNAISANGERVFWTSLDVNLSQKTGPGRIYVRIDPDPGIDGDERTVAVSQSASSGDAFFWGASTKGTKAIFESLAAPVAHNLYTFDVDAEKRTLIAEDSLGVLGMSADATRVYFASTQAIPGSGQNGLEAEAVPDAPNLYLYEERDGAKIYHFIGTLSDTDVSKVGIRPITAVPLQRASRVSADGLHAVFMSTAPLTGYDNTDSARSVPATEVFLFDAEASEGAGQSVCVSCNSSGARPAGGKLLDARGSDTGIPAAGRIPGWERPLYPSRLLASDGNRLFFESFEALVLRDTNGVQDVYEWERVGTGDCDRSAVAFSEQADGCVDLMSSGESPAPSYFRDASPNGNDVFFATLSSLLPQDYGLVDIYDARVGGGFPQSVETPACEGEACQGPIAAPNDPTPASSSFEGAGNVVEGNAKGKKKAKRCPTGKGKVKLKGKVSCQKKHKAKRKHHRHHRKSKHERRAAR